MNKQLIFNELKKGDYISRKSPNVQFSTLKIGHFFIINLKIFPNWDTLLLRLCYLFRKQKEKNE